AFLQRHHIANKTDCSVCWARPLCSGGCYHEAHTRYGETTHANLHYCEWIRGWTDVCLKVYGELSVRNPAFLEQFDRETEAEKVSGTISEPSIARPLESKRPRPPTWSRCSGPVRRSCRTFPSAARWCSRPDGRPIGPAGPPACASQSNAIS